MALFAVVLVGGCSRGGELPPSSAKGFGAVSIPGPAEAWAVSETNPRCPTPAVLWNGLIGLRLGRDGTAASANPGGWPMFDIDEYDVDGEEKIRPLSNPLRFTWLDGSPIFDPLRVRDYFQALHFDTGVLTSIWNSDHARFGSIRIRSDVVLHPSKRMIGVRWSVKSKEDALGHVVKFAFAGERNGSGGTVIQRGGSRFLVRERSVPNGGSTTVEVVVSIGRSPAAQRLIEARQPGEYDWAADFDKPEPTQSFDEIAAAAKKFHSGPNAPDIEIDGPVEDQQAIRSFLFYLRSAVHSQGNMAVAPMGLSSQTYHGHVFWDADIWVFPALALIEPERAASITRYRMNSHRRAETNFQTWLNEGRPTGTGKLGVVHNFGLAMGAKFPWESSVTGKETVPGPSKFQDHITGSVAFTMGQARALGLAHENDAKALLDGADTFYRFRSEGGGDVIHHLRGTMSPDENHTGDDDLYTNLLAQWCLNRGKLESDIPEMPNEFYLPHDEKSFLTYEGDPERTYKQAAAVLAIYPLQFPEAEKQAKVMMERFAPKVTPNGPAMSDSVHALIWARIGEKEKAYETWRKSWQDFTKHPLLLFSEKRSKEVTYFTTGAGGCLQAVIYGFLGFRIDEKALSGDAWTKPLEYGRTLSIKPNLPPAWKRAVFKNFQVFGERMTLDVDGPAFQVRK